ncbi:MAG: hypothetical protein BAJATHORv1_40021 [Candidatus Thorarchaeota archaeon]|nr:MAG: hypothetical protein BAJATHORv1_40021 [Candidatus Thorarchaeota archaeon]
MVRVIPFKAYRYNKDKISDMSKVVSPPYDIIKGKKVDKLQSLSQYNISWIIKNKPQDDDTDVSNQYTRARDLLHQWIEEGVLKQENSESFYVYGWNFTVDGEELFRFGFIGLIELEEFATEAPESGSFAGVLQHEETLPKDIIDRLSLLRETKANFGQIFVIYPDHEGEVDKILEKAMKEKAIIDVTEEEGVRHRIWRISNPEDTGRITQYMKDKYVIIADGHHRYKTALAFSKEEPGLESAKYRMLTFVNTANPGLVILPTHRIVQNLEDFDKIKLLDGVKKEFDIQEFSNKDEMFSRMDKEFNEGKHSLGLFMDDGKFYVLTLRDTSAMDKAMPEKSEEYRKLDVAMLHKLVLDKVLGIDKEKLSQGTMTGGGYVVYIKGIGDAVEQSINSVKEEAQAVFFMNPTRLSEVEAVSRNFECMPQKSTFFFPKVWTGFTINKLD